MKVLVLVLALLAVLVAAPNQARADGVGPAVWPLDPLPTVVRRFDPPESPWGSGHRGVDLLGRPGQEVRTALAGTVSFAGTLAGRGVVVVSHGATRTTYEPVAASVRVGDAVPPGGVIGTLQTGLSHCFPRSCLHWGLLEGATYLDPLSLLGFAPVRLLPLFTPWGALAGMPYGVALP
jgi:murein DD-endopeptidase MepM/ murein hydrolase activator NlpD